MTVTDTPWGQISISFISTGPGGAAGEIHVSHQGALFGRREALNEILSTFPGVKELELNEKFWVLKAPGRAAQYAEALAEAIASRAAKGEMDAVSTAPSPKRRSRGDRYVNNPRRR